MSTSRQGGLKGLIQKTGKFFYSNGVLVRDSVSGVVKFSYKWGGKVAFVLATTSMVTFMPLLFEIAREQQMLEMEKLQVNDLKSKGYNERQLKDMGFSESSLHSPSVAAASIIGK